MRVGRLKVGRYSLQYQTEHNNPDQTLSKKFIGSAACWSRGQHVRYVLNNPIVWNKPFGMLPGPVLLSVKATIVIHAALPYAA